MKKNVLWVLSGLALILALGGCPSPTGGDITYTVTFNTQGGSTIAAQTVDAGSQVSKPDNPTRVGYVFDNWYDAATGGAVIGWPLTVTSDITVYARWTSEGGTTQYTVTFDTQDGSAVEPQTVNAGSQASKPNNPTKEGFEFDNWYDAATGGAVIGWPLTVTSDITVYARWNTAGANITKYTVTYNTQGGSTITAQEVNDYSQLNKPGDPAKEGYVFDDWYTTATGGTVVSWPLTVTGHITVYAQWTIASYNIIYELNGGTNHAGNPATYTIESDNITLQAPTKNGYTFGGWYTDSGFTTQAGSPAIAAGSTGIKTFYAKWTIDSYDITYELDGGTNNADNPAVYTIESTAITLQAPTKANYTFGGWYMDNSFTTQAGSPAIATGSTGIKTFYAKWTINTYTVTFDTQGGSPIATETVDAGSQVSKPDNPTRVGYVFDNWYTAATGGVVISWPLTVTDNTTVYARWTPEGENIPKYTVTYNTQGGSMVTAQEVNAGSKLNKPGNPTRVGYVFDDWYTTATGGTVVSWPLTVTGDITVYARWTAISYDIIYNLNGGTNHAGNPTDYTIESAAITLQAPTKIGYTFDGWYTDSGFTTQAGSTAIAAGSTDIKTFYAKWNINTYTVTFDSNGGTAIDAITNVDYNTKITAPAVPTKADNTFAAWYKEVELTNQWNFAVDTVTANTTLYAKWTINTYTVTYNTQGGSTVTAQEVNANSQLNKPSDPTKEGFVFDNWYTDATGGAVVNWPLTVTGDITVYARWTIASYDIIYNLNGGTNHADNPATYTIESDNITLQAPAKNGYTFGGWYTDSGFTAPAGSPAIAAGSTDIKTFYAQWTIDSYNIIYELNGGTNHAGNPAAYTIESDNITLQTPTKNGYTFGGWYTDSGFTTQAGSPAIAAGSTDDKTFYARWQSGSGGVDVQSETGITDADLTLPGTGPFSGDFTITAPTGFASYTWTIDGKTQTETSHILTVNTAGLTNGGHTARLTVTTGSGTRWSAQTTFTVAK
ncbi:hypothetical protein AGMMS49928_29100 [Spirochaetia bacterium]|nr:hypothetical protein AGMMS49928_29100 [Spirochaetia bacterium]